MAHHLGRKFSMISRVRSTSRSPASRFLGRFVRALLYSVQTGLAHTKSKCPKAASSNSMTSQQMVGWNLGSRSTETTSRPLAAKALPIDPVPLKSSRSLGILFPRVACEPDKGDQLGDEAGHLQVADHAVAPGHGRRRVEGVLVGRVHPLFFGWVI